MPAIELGRMADILLIQKEKYMAKKGVEHHKIKGDK